MEAQQQQKPSAALHDLIVINHDRTEGYKTASDETKDEELKKLFTEMSQQSQKFSDELSGFGTSSEDKPGSPETKNTGKLYRVWMDIKAAITAKDRKAILASCEFGEDVAKQHYEEVLNHPDNLPSGALAVIRKQYESILTGHDKVKSLRDSAK